MQSYKHHAGTKFNTKHVASLTQADWLKEAKGQYDLGTTTAAQEEAELKSIHAECQKLAKESDKKKEEA